MLVHCPSHLTVANSPDQEQQLVFSCTFEETKETFYHILLSHNNLDFFFLILTLKKKKPYVMVKLR